MSTGVDDFLSILLELVGDTDESVVLGNTYTLVDSASDEAWVIGSKNREGNSRSDRQGAPVCQNEGKALVLDTWAE